MFDLFEELWVDCGFCEDFFGCYVDVECIVDVLDVVWVWFVDFDCDFVVVG